MGESFLQELESVAWFSTCGHEVTAAFPMPTVQVSSLSEAIDYCSSEAWEGVTLEARNQLTEFLHSNYPEADSKWNEITIRAKAQIITPLIANVWQPYARQHGLGKVFIDSISWDVLAATMELEFSDCIGRPSFFTDLLQVYRAGKFPCGWQGTWPSGSLLVW